MTRHLSVEPAMTALAPSFTALTGSYTLDPTHTRIGFVARHAMVTKVRGSFDEFQGTATIDGDNTANSSVRVTIDAASIDTRNADRDAHLRTNDFLAQDQYPQITFASTDIRQVDETTFEVTGDLTIKDVTNRITVPFEFEGTSQDPSATTASASTARSPSAARTTASPGTRHWRPAASWSATRSSSSSRSPRSRTPDSAAGCRRPVRDRRHRPRSSSRPF